VLQVPRDQPGQPDPPGRQVHWLDPSRRTRYSPRGVDGQPSRVASLVTNTRPARNASATLSTSVTGIRDSAVCFDAIPGKPCVGTQLSPGPRLFPIGR
jgi:hypothetical protein